MKPTPQWAVAVAQLVELLLPIPEVWGSNPKTDKIYIEHWRSQQYWKDKNKEKAAENRSIGKKPSILQIPNYFDVILRISALSRQLAAIVNVSKCETGMINLTGQKRGRLVDRIGVWNSDVCHCRCRRCRRLPFIYQMTNMRNTKTERVERTM